MNKNHYVAIMAGGIGSRFWPMSRTNHPKQFLDILGTGETLLQSTFARFTKIVPETNIYIVTSQEYVDKVHAELPSLPLTNIVAEPSRKNTAPCIAYIAFKLHQLNPDAVMVASPADHLIQDVDAFSETISAAFTFLEKESALITIGIKPSHPNTGYGYIQHELKESTSGIYKVKTFTEKPNLDLAKTFLASGDFLWNAGIFTWKVKDILSAFESHLPEMYEVFYTEQASYNTSKEKDAIEKIYSQCTNISIDFGIMEKAHNVFVLPASFAWSDLGTWNSAWENIDKDYFQNAVVGENTMIIDAKNCMIHAPNQKLIVLQGLEDYIVVDTKDALLICKKDKEQEIKEYVAEVKRNKGDRYL